MPFIIVVFPRFNQTNTSMKLSAKSAHQWPPLGRYNAKVSVRQTLTK